MKLYVALGLFVGFMALVGGGILLAFAGNPGLLLAALAAYGMGFARFGCRAH